MIRIETTDRNGQRLQKPFAWSYSQLKNFETCPKRYHHINVLKDVIEEKSDQLAYGDLVHKVMQDYLGKGTAMPPYHEPKLKPWADKIKNAGPGALMVEQKFALTREFKATKYFGNDVWFRGIGDVVKINGPVGLIVDWKTGKVKEDATQLVLMAACLFASYPDLRKVLTKFVWLEADCESKALIDRADMPGHWNNILPRIKQVEEAHAQQSFPPKPSGLCRRWCPVAKCEHHGT